MARFQLEAGPIPLHHQVYLDLRAALERGEWRPGDRLPTERDLAARYGCSLITVRHALGELVREERIERTRGRGTFVTQPRIDRDFAGGLSFAEEMRVRGLLPETRVITLEIQPASEPVASALELEADASVVYLERLRAADGEPLLLEQAQLPASRFAGVVNFDLEHNSLYDLLAEHFGARVARAREAIEPVLLAKREAGVLGVAPRTPALLIEGIAFSDEERPVEFARSYVRSDRTRYYLERTVHRASWIRSLKPAPRSAGERQSRPAAIGERAEQRR
jgi:GntR family transcriptional regulator